MKKRMYLCLVCALLIYLFAFYDVARAVLLAAAVHELGHVLALKLMGAKLTGFRIQPGGLLISCTGTRSEINKLISALAGPVAGILFALTALRIGKCADITWLMFSGELSIVYSLFNLLPAYPLDGGLALSSLLSVHYEEDKSNSICTYINALISALLIGTGLYMFLSWHGAALFSAGMWLLLFQDEDKKPCKRD